jgi:hypothetical protein
VNRISKLDHIKNYLYTKIVLAFPLNLNEVIEPMREVRNERSLQEIVCGKKNI